MEENSVKSNSLESSGNPQQGQEQRRFRRPFFRGPRRPKQCLFCVDSSKVIEKDPVMLRRFVSDRNRILSRRITGLCTQHQSRVAKTVKRCRNLALMR